MVLTNCRLQAHSQLTKRFNDTVVTGLLSDPYQQSEGEVAVTSKVHCRRTNEKRAQIFPKEYTYFP
jgi:hypothetical protein